MSGTILKRGRFFAALASALVLLVLAAGVGVYLRGGWYALQFAFLPGSSLWLPVANDDPRLSPSMRLALRPDPPKASAGQFVWQDVGVGFEVGELPVTADEQEVDRLLLARINPARYRFLVRNAPGRDRKLDGWMTQLGAALVVNGSYFTRDGLPETPIVSGGIRLGPVAYKATHGAFVVSGESASIRDLRDESWEDALQNADEAIVSYPLLLSPDGPTRVKADRRWLANRSFVGEDDAGEIVIGTTSDAFFSLDRFAEFLRDAPLHLKFALNLDGGSIACQAVAVNAYRRDFCGQWESNVQHDQLKLLAPVVGHRRWGLPNVLAAVAR